MYTALLLYYKVDQMKENEKGGHEARIGKMRNAYKIFVGETEGKRRLERPRSRCEDNIRMDIRRQGGKMWT
jgi:hypothetical protein